MRDNPGAQYQISVDGVPRTHRDRQDIALQTARFLKSQNFRRAACHALATVWASQTEIPRSQR